MESPGVLRIMLVYGMIGLVLVGMTWFPRSWWARVLWSRHGPETTPDRMTRGEAFRSAAGFLGIAVTALVIAIIASIGGDWLYGTSDRSLTLAALNFMAALGVMLGVGGATYMSVRALFRPATLYRWGEDPLASATLLKQYLSADELYAAWIYEHSPTEYEVVERIPLPDDAVVGVTPRAFQDGMLVSLARTTTLEEAERRALEATGHLPSPERDPLPPQ